MPERPDLQAAKERLRLMDVSDLFLRRKDVDLVLACLEELEADAAPPGHEHRTKEVSTAHHAFHHSEERYHRERSDRLDAAEADARAMREAIGHVVGILGYQGMWCLVCHHIEGEHGHWDGGGGKTFGTCPVLALGAAALRGWSPSWVRA